MRIGLPATRSPPRLDARRRGFAMIGRHTESVSMSDVRTDGCAGSGPAQGMPARRDAIRSHAASHAQRSEHGCQAARLLARQGSPVAQRCARNLVTTVTRRRVLARSANARIAASRPGPDTGARAKKGPAPWRRPEVGRRRRPDRDRSRTPRPFIPPLPASGSTERAGGRSGQSLQPVSEAIGEASQRISTSSRPSFSKARQSVTSVSRSNGPCSRPVASSMTVQVGSQTGMPR